jgi:BirA family transcriptional regulator, biotin operon repressor / biotin---[acetyl-CoA-carboxylase] ligase
LASAFDRVRFASRLTTRRLGRTLVARAEVGSTNDEAWDALAADAPDGTVVVADVQTRGRGRAGRAWHTAPGRALALSVLLHRGCDRRSLGLLPLAAGLAVAQALEALGAAPTLKWPNDVLLAGRKVAGVLCESRRIHPAPGRPTSPPGREVAPAGARDAAVVGVGVNVAQGAGDFPPEIAGTATSLALAGVAADRESVAAAFLDALERLWVELQEGGRAALLAAWSERADFWGRTVTVSAPGGVVRGVARALDPDGALVLAFEDGTEAVVMAGDLETAPGEGAQP